MPARETILALPSSPDRIPPAVAIRSTTLISSLGTLRTLGMAEAYFAQLPAEHHAAIRDLIAGVWLPMDLGVAHYAAIEGLKLSSEQARENGRKVAQSVQNAYFATLVRTLGSGVTLWTVLPRLPSFLGRLVDGGACAVYKDGPKDARIEIHGVPIARFGYVRLGWAGMFESSLELIARKVYVRDVSSPRTPSAAAFTIAWV
jgi:hypothetical protein